MVDLNHKLISAFLAVVAATALSMAHSMAHNSAESRMDPDVAIEYSESAIGRLIGPYILADSKGEPLAMDSFRGRPLVISLIYTSCPEVCPVTTQHVMQAVETARGVVGEEAFAVLSLGFDARRDTPTQLDAFARAQGIDLSDWQLASADARTIHALVDNIGFSFEEAAGGFAHITQTTILDAEGRVYRQVYGNNFPDRIFVEPLKELIFGTPIQSFSLGDLVKRVKFICTVYNPSSGAYEFDYAIFFGIAFGGLSLILSGVVIFRLWRGNQRTLAIRSGREPG